MCSWGECHCLSSSGLLQEGATPFVPSYLPCYIGKSKTAFTVTVPKGLLRIRIPSQKRAYPCIVGLKSPKENKCQPIWGPDMKKRGKEMEEQLRYLPSLGISKHNVQGRRPWSSSTFKHRVALLLWILYTLVTDWSQVAISTSLALGSLLWVLYGRNQH